LTAKNAKDAKADAQSGRPEQGGVAASPECSLAKEPAKSGHLGALGVLGGQVRNANELSLCSFTSEVKESTAEIAEIGDPSAISAISAVLTGPEREGSCR